MNHNHQHHLCRVIVALFVLCVLMTGCQDKQESTQDGSGEIYYLSAEGSDEWNGTEEKPFRTFSYALEKLKPGDTLYVRGGTYTELVEIPEDCSGNQENYITISAYSGEEVILDGSGQDSPALLTVDGASYLNIRGLELTGACGEDACGITILPGSHHLLLSDNSIHDITVPDPEREDHCANGILLLGDDAERSIHDITLQQNELYDCETGWSECISVTGNCTGIDIISNTVRNTGNIGIDLSGNYGYCDDPAKDFPRDCLISQNTVSECVSSYATAYGIYVDGGQEIEIRENTVTACSGGIEVGAEQAADEQYSTSDILIQDNTLQNNIDNAITIGGYETNLGWVKDVNVVENICENNGIHNAILTLAKCSGITLRGNTFCNDSGDAAIIYSEFGSSYTRDITFEDNVYSNGRKEEDTNFVYLGKTYTSFDRWLEAAGEDAGTYR